jgi:NADH dehydrogenase FAD-containing subunit
MLEQVLDTVERMSRPRVVIAGLGDSGLLTAIHLSRHADVVGISTKPGLVSGKELGTRLTRPQDWVVDYWISFDRYRRLDAARTIHGTVTGVDLDERVVRLTAADGTPGEEPYDVLVISTGVSNGFWRQPGLLSVDDVAADLEVQHRTLAEAGSVVVLGGGAAAVSSAFNVATRWPEKRVDLYFPGPRGLQHHHPQVWDALRARLTDVGVGLHPEHRAVIPEGFECDRITDDPVAWSTGQAPATADAVLWTIGKVRPNTGWLPDHLLDEQGFVVVDPTLRVPGHPGVFAIGDVAATDPLRNSARNRADRLLARNIRAELAGRSLGDYRPRRRRWGSVTGVQSNGLEVFAPRGQMFRFPAWSIRGILNGLIVRRGIYRGVRRRAPTSGRG